MKIIKIVNATTGEELEREMNATEIADYEEKSLARKQAQEKEADAKALRDSANEKLAALGLTPQEIAAITA